MYINFSHFFERRGKTIYVQNKQSKKIGEWILSQIAKKNSFPTMFYHYQPGGHVAALHQHINNRFFFKIDIKNFFYSISRNRVAAALYEIGISKARTYAKWSCVKNPLQRNPAYSLPIGFVQSSALASLVLLRTPIVSVLEKSEKYSTFVSVYLDDIIASSNDLNQLTEFYDALLNAINKANFSVNLRKLIPPATQIDAFNCNLRQGCVEVSEERIKKSVDCLEKNQSAFSEYCTYVSSMNHAALSI